MNSTKLYIIVINALITFLLGTHISKSYAQQTGFEVTLEADYDIMPVSFKRMDDGEYVGIVRKAIYADSLNAANTFLYRISSSGDTMATIFSKPDTIYNYFHIDKLVTGEGGFLLSGYGYKIGEPSNYLFTILTKLDNDLNIVWEKVYTFNYYYAGFTSSILELSNGEIIYACAPHLNMYMFIMKISQQGDMLDFKAYSGDESGEVWSLTYNHDSTSLLLSTQWAYYPGGGYVSSIITLNNELEQVDVDYYPEHFHPPFNSLLLNNDYMLAGGSDQFYGTNEFLFQVGAYLLDTAFNIAHQIHLTDPDTNSRGGDVQAVDFYYQNCIYLGGTHNLQGITGSYPSWYYITKLNDTLGLEYEKYIGGDYYYWLMSITASMDGGVLLAGFFSEIGQTNVNLKGLIIKLDSTGCITNLPHNPQISITDAILYPNPGIDVIKVRTGLTDCTFKLWDISGHNLINTTLSGLISTMDVSFLKSGNYFYSIERSNKTVISGTWIKQ